MKASFYACIFTQSQQFTSLLDLKTVGYTRTINAHCTFSLRHQTSCKKFTADHRSHLVVPIKASLDDGIPSNNSFRQRQPIPSFTRALGVDYGSRQIGMAISTLGLAPRPLQHLQGARNLVDMMSAAQDIVNLALSEGCDGIVIGLPVTQNGALRKRSSDSQQGRRCRNFAEAVAAFATRHDLTVVLTDESGTTMQAERLIFDSGNRRAPAKGRKDSVAAALILDNYFNDPGEAVVVRPPRLGKKQQGAPSTANNNNSGSSSDGN